MDKYRGWLVYRRKDYEKNREFADRFAICGKALNLEISLVFREDIASGIFDGKPEIRVKGNPVSIPDFVINRSMDAFLAKQLETLGCRAFNSSRISDVCNNKAKTCFEVSLLGIPMVDTLFVSTSGFDVPLSGITFPAVVKSVGGRSGSEVAKAESMDELTGFISSVDSRDFVVQKLCGMPGRDVRVFVVGKRIIGAVLRYSSNDFRANYSLGGSSRLYSLNRAEKETVQRIIDNFDFDMVGVDFIFDSEGKFLFNEIEDVVGCRTLYKNSDIDILVIYLEHIRMKLEGCKK